MLCTNRGCPSKLYLNDNYSVIFRCDLIYYITTITNQIFALNPKMISNSVKKKKKAADRKNYNS